jgi:hypothetical protein
MWKASQTQLGGSHPEGQTVSPALFPQNVSLAPQALKGEVSVLFKLAI